MQNLNKRLNQSHVQERLRRLEEGREIDWSTAEALAIGTLLLQSECATVYITTSWGCCMCMHMYVHSLAVIGRWPLAWDNAIHLHTCTCTHMYACTHAHAHAHTHTPHNTHIHTHFTGFNVRLSGQDVGRGTFSHRHVMMVCQDTDRVVIPLNHLTEDQTSFLEVRTAL